MANIVRFRLRSDTRENWTSKNPVLLRGEPGFDETARRFKMGDGIRNWNALPYEAPDILNALDSDRTDAALSAAQGKEVKRNLDILQNSKADKSDIPAPNPMRVRLNSKSISGIGLGVSSFVVPDGVYSMLFSGTAEAGRNLSQPGNYFSIYARTGTWCLKCYFGVTPGDTVRTALGDPPQGREGNGRSLKVLVNQKEVIVLAGGTGINANGVSIGAAESKFPSFTSCQAIGGQTPETYSYSGGNVGIESAGMHPAHDGVFGWYGSNFPGSISAKSGLAIFEWVEPFDLE